MEKIIKHNIDQYYVGELVIGEVYDSFLEFKQPLTFDDVKERFNLIKNGAINVSNGYEISIKDRTRKSVSIAVFYKIDDEQYLCLQSGIIYRSYGISHYRKLRMLSEFLPKIDYTTKEQLSLSEAIILFKKLLGKNHKLYSLNEHSIAEFYIGKIRKPESIRQSGISTGSELKIMPFEYYMLMKNGAKNGETLFLEQDKKLINLQCNTILESGFFPGIGSISKLIPLSESQKTKRLKLPDKLTITQVLKQYR